MGFFDWMRKQPTPAKKAPARRDAFAGTYGQGSPGGFAGAGVNRLTASLSTWAGSVNYDLDGGNNAILRARARQIAQNDEYGRRFLSMVATNVVGRTGPALQVRAYNDTTNPKAEPTLDKAANDAIEIHYKRWGKKADIGGRMGLAHLYRVAAKTVARDGEAVVRIVRRRDLPYGIALQLIEADRIPDDLNQVLPNGSIRQGVELDTTGRATHLWLRTSHPGDRYGAPKVELERVPMADLRHVFLQERAEQVRGYSWFHAVLLRAHQFHGFNDSAVLAARIGASKVAVLQRGEEQPDVTATMADGQTGGPQGALQMNVEGGEMFELPPGYTLDSWNPDYPHQNYESFSKTALEGISAGLDVAAHNLTGNMSGVNYSSARIAELSEREVWMILQDWFIDQLAEPIFQEWLAIAMLRGDIKFEVTGKALPAEKLSKFANAARFQGRRWRWVDPAKEVEGNAAAVDLGVTSRTRIAAEQGDDIDDVFDELAQEQKRMKDLGLPTGPAAYPPQGGAPLPKPAAPAPAGDE